MMEPLYASTTPGKKQILSGKWRAKFPMPQVLKINHPITIVDAAVQKHLSDIHATDKAFATERGEDSRAYKVFALQYRLGGSLYIPHAGDLGKIKLRKLSNSLTEISINESPWNTATENEIIRYSYWSVDSVGHQEKDRQKEIAIENTKRLMMYREKVITRLLDGMKNDGLLDPPVLKNQKQQTSASHKELFIDTQRINELRSIKSNHFDLTKLIKLCEEVNECYSNECYIAVSMLSRAIIDHVPPIFGFRIFSEIVSQYSGGKSFRQCMNHLENSMRKIADFHLHSQSRSRETLPNKVQVNFSSDVDVLLAEVVRLLK